MKEHSDFVKEIPAGVPCCPTWWWSGLNATNGKTYAPCHPHISRRDGHRQVYKAPQKIEGQTVTTKYRQID